MVSSPLGNRTYHTVLRLMRILPTEQVCVHVDKGDGVAYPKKRPRTEEGEEEPERRFPVRIHRSFLYSSVRGGFASK